ncbi:MAG: Omp28-related outer membrane protein, partial [Bacteroidales bacterium]
TGVRCPNCPSAAVIAKQLLSVYKDSLIVVALHPMGDFLTTPYVGDPDLRSEAADAYYDYYKVSALGLPTGMVNRGQAPGELLKKDLWRNAVSTYFPLIAVAQLTANASFTGSTKEAFNVNINGKITGKYAKEGSLNLIVMVLEDSIVLQQNTPDGKIKGYMQNHVLRTTLDDPWGVKVLDSKPEKEATFKKDYSDVAVNEKWNKAHLSVVVILSNETTKEVIQVAYTHIK